jgi:carboxyl-terminal processing protease
MTCRFPSKGRAALALAALVGALFVQVRSSAEPTPGKYDRTVTQLVTEILHDGHLKQPEIGDQLSERLFKRFLKSVDPAKLYLLKEDFEEFKKQETQLDDMLRNGDLSFPYHVYQRLLQRMSERQKLIEEWIDAKHDFTAKEYFETDADKVDYAREDELRERWRQRIKFDLLLQRVGQKPLPEAEARKKVRERYQSVLRTWKQLDNFDLMEAYLTSLMECVDPHGGYLSPNTVEDFDIALRLKLEGIGARLRTASGHTVVMEIVPGGAAAQDGRLKANDKIIGVAQGDGKFTDVIDQKIRDVVKLIRGPKGTKVDLKVLPAGKLEPVVYTLVRKQVELTEQQARYEIIEDGKKADGTPYRIGVIDLPSFYGDGRPSPRSATEHVRRILKELTAKGVDGVILDMQRNGGGLLNEAVSLSGLFIDRGPIVQVKGSNAPVRRLDDPEAGAAYDGPLVVLISRFSASAAEILAGSMQDYGRALIVGDTATHGKGTVQAVVDLSQQMTGPGAPKLGAMKLTIQQFYRVNGDSTQNRGVAADVVLPSLSEHIATPEEKMDYALPFDRVKPAAHAGLGLVGADVKGVLQARSAERVKGDKEFAKLVSEIERLKVRRARTKAPLNEKEFKEQFSQEDEVAELNDDDPPPAAAAYRFPRNFRTNEILRVTEDFIQGKKLTSGP